jgi:hypothetical protein
VTGDYLAFNQVDALRLLLVWSQREGHARDAAPELPHRGQLRVHVVETAQSDGTERAFHPKCWLFESPSFGVAFVGSSNLSRSALQTGIERNLRVERAIDPTACSRVRVRPQRWRGDGKDKGAVPPSYCPFFGAPSATTATATSLKRGPLLPLCRRSLRSW